MSSTVPPTWTLQARALASAAFAAWMKWTRQAYGRHSYRFIGNSKNGEKTDEVTLFAWLHFASDTKCFAALQTRQEYGCCWKTSPLPLEQCKAANSFANDYVCTSFRFKTTDGQHGPLCSATIPNPAWPNNFRQQGPSSCLPCSHADKQAIIHRLIIFLLKRSWRTHINSVKNYKIWGT